MIEQHDFILATKGHRGNKEHIISKAFGEHKQPCRFNQLEYNAGYTLCGRYVSSCNHTIYKIQASWLGAIFSSFGKCAKCEREYQKLNNYEPIIEGGQK